MILVLLLLFVFLSICQYLSGWVWNLKTGECFFVIVGWWVHMYDYLCNKVLYSTKCEEKNLAKTMHLDLTSDGESKSFQA